MPAVDLCDLGRSSQPIIVVNDHVIVRRQVDIELDPVRARIECREKPGDGVLRIARAGMTAGLTLVFLDQTAVSVALPSIKRDLGATHAELAWVMNAFLLTLAALAALGGRLGDLAGRPRVLVWGVVVFSLASLACGLAPPGGWQIA